MYLSPRPTAAAYRRFYEGGGDWDSTYHRLSDFTNIAELLRSHYGKDLSMSREARENMRRFMHEHRIRADLSSTGRMLVPWRDLHPCAVSGVEPKKESVRTARRLGIDLVQGFSGDARIPEHEYDLVLNTRTINHQLDPLADLRHAWRWLKPGGVVFVDIPDAIRKARWNGFEQSTVEIDHPYMFTLNTLTAFVQRAGLEVVGRDLCRNAAGRSRQAEHHTRIHIVGPKSTTEPAVVWSRYETERADLDQARAEHAADVERSSRERQLRTREQQLAKRERQLAKEERHLAKRERRRTKRERQLEEAPPPESDPE